MFKFFIIVLLAIIQTSCASSSSITRKDIEDFSYGEPPTKKEVIDFVIDSAGFYDPFSVKITCNPPFKGWADVEAYSGRTIGWVTTCQYYAKNRLGAYTGAKEITVVTMYNSHQFVAGSFGL